MDKKNSVITIQKGLCCICVFLCHFWGVMHTIGNDLIDEIFWNDGPLEVFTSGNVAVCIFMVISAYLLGKKARNNDYDIGKIVIKRYFRLTIPCGVIALFGVLFYKLGAFQHYIIGQENNNVWLLGHYSNPIGWMTAIKEALFGIILLGRTETYPEFWMMKYMFWGTIVSIIVIELLKNVNSIIKIVGGVILVVFWGRYIDSYYCCFILGALWALFEDESSIISKILASKFCALLWPVGWGIAALSMKYEGVRNVVIIRAVAAVLIVRGFMSLIEWMKCFFPKNRLTNGVYKCFIKLGEISFGIYSVHILVMCSIFSWWWKFFEDGNPFVRCELNYIVSMLITIILAYLFHEFVEKKLFGTIWKTTSKLIYNKKKLS